MLHANLPVAPKRSAPSSLVCESETTPSSTGSTDNSVSQRFYRSLECENRPETAEFPDHTLAESAAVRRQLLLEDTRRTALHTLSLCRNVIASLEITRLSKSRTGLHYWLGFWDQIYDRPFSRVLSSRVTSALARIDALFRAVSGDLHQLTRRMQHVVTYATTERDILHYLERMEDEVSARRRRRRKKAQAILNKLRATIESIPVKVTDELFDDLKRGVFALDVFCDYHPGDPVAEEHEREALRPTRIVEVSPYVPRTQPWNESAAAGAYMPSSSAYTDINTDWSEYVGDWAHTEHDSRSHNHHAHHAHHAAHHR
ncbi:hypothetical protein BO94DRAFT_502019 [Aspergillus sclerotioniger CBS 115572]|uniref:Uncharacterized protein n=1 Tax=Aspergillus sclerotioniger CBS 115572 TaxID=1450535 RepID=A0A317V9L3_9EURO|nr:hypothetical protein BO94DRAFT_502019 [Aspergillus sclerotioniger CBS 115572]PWY71093.1 hypothetical protein BO94DRAFT_502019 [Aspergillus sclerotioniger CBS 115572]